MIMLKRLLVLLACGFAAGVFASFWFGPGLVAWWFEPPGGVQQAGFIGWDTVRRALAYLVRVQITTGLGTGLVVAVVGELVHRRRAAGKAPAAPAAAPEPASLAKP